MTLDGKIVGMLGKAGHQLKQFGWIHGMACPNENTLFVAEVLNWRVQKLVLHPEQAGEPRYDARRARASTKLRLPRNRPKAISPRSMTTRGATICAPRRCN